ncbi:MAG: LUD domain-containing protein [Bacteroidia bacterium]|nr:LUD domain-containing protein [Bacteroidia bacterium]MCZ2247795.1 LUD domain-containing protein [Bacteroidia bacterium]
MEQSTSREKILKKVRNALMNKSPKDTVANIDFESEVFAKAVDDLELVFAQNFTEAGGRFIFCENNVVLIETIEEFANNIDLPGNIVCQEPIIQELLQVAETKFQTEFTDSTPIVISSCEQLVARTGSVMVSSKQGTEKRALLNAPFLIVIASTNQLVGDTKQALIEVRKRYNGTFPNMLSIITNPIDTENKLNNNKQNILVLLIDAQD